MRWVTTGKGRSARKIAVKGRIARLAPGGPHGRRIPARPIYLPDVMVQAIGQEKP